MKRHPETERSARRRPRSRSRAETAAPRATTPAAARPRPPGRRAEAARIEHAAAILDRLDVARHLLRLEPVGTRTALVLQLLEQTADDVADLAGMASGSP